MFSWRSASSRADGGLMPKQLDSNTLIPILFWWMFSNQSVSVQPVSTRSSETRFAFSPLSPLLISQWKTFFQPSSVSLLLGLLHKQSLSLFPWPARGSRPKVGGEGGRAFALLLPHSSRYRKYRGRGETFWDRPFSFLSPGGLLGGPGLLFHTPLSPGEKSPNYFFSTLVHTPCK